MMMLLSRGADQSEHNGLIGRGGGSAKAFQTRDVPNEKKKSVYGSLKQK